MLDTVLFVVGAALVVYLSHKIGKTKGVMSGYNKCINELVQEDYLSFKSEDGKTGVLLPYDAEITKPEFEIQLKI
jgi:hypothetical protein